MRFPARHTEVVGATREDLVHEDFESLQANGRGQRVPAERAAMRPGGKDRHHLLPPHEGGDRIQPTSECLTNAE